MPRLNSLLLTSKRGLPLPQLVAGDAQRYVLTVEEFVPRGTSDDNGGAVTVRAGQVGVYRRVRRAGDVIAG